MPTMTDYTALDAAIISAIQAGKREFIPICGYGNAHAQALADAANAGLPRRLHVDAWRIVDRRLQALRKAGRIYFTRPSKKNPGGGWTLTE